MDMKLKDKVVVVTGGAGDIGGETVMAFLREGSKAAVCGRSKNKLDDFKAQAKKEGFDVLTGIADVTDMDSLEKFAKLVADEYGGIDIWINCAGIEGYTPLIECTEEFWDQVIDINLTGTWRGIKVAVPYMEKRGGGSIVNLSSFCSLMPTAKNGVYSISKAGVDSLTKVMAAELAPKNIRVNSVIPGFIATEMTRDKVATIEDMLVEPISMRRLGNPGDVARGILFLAGDGGRYVDGHALVISGGKFLVQNPQDPWNNYEGGY
jgi:NAD(P)-dependent dehydrogenase (short-subunit alcohol dehydrogenase family)